MHSKDLCQNFHNSMEMCLQNLLFQVLTQIFGLLFHLPLFMKIETCQILTNSTFLKVQGCNSPLIKSINLYKCLCRIVNLPILIDFLYFKRQRYSMISLIEATGQMQQSGDTFARTLNSLMSLQNYGDFGTDIYLKLCNLFV